jgi:hypothetical protein
MSDLYVIWAQDLNKAQARLDQLCEGASCRVLRRGNFPLIQAEDLDARKSLDSGGERYCIVFELG